MPTKLLTVLILLVTSCCLAQRPGAPLIPIKRTASIILNETQILAEDCSNGRDDNGNGLVDCEDYSCYFQKPASTCNCVPSNTLWTTNALGELYWANTVTSVEVRVGAMGQVMTDIAWTPDGKLYGLDFNANVYEIDPATAAVTHRFSIPGNAAANAMTSDGDGNLYIAGGTRIFKFSRSNNAVAEVADLSVPGLTSGGDLAFSGGALFLSCMGNMIAKIDIATKRVEARTIINLPPGANIFGIVSSADGSLYISGTANIFKLNPLDMRAEPYYVYKTTSVDIWGLANYNDNCNAPEPDCKAAVDIAVETPSPFCSDAGVKLTASGTGITGTPRYNWQTPDGAVANAASIVARKTGWYKVNFSAQDRFCHDADSVFLTMLPRPVVNIGRDTVMCVGTQFVIRNQYSDPSFINEWHNRSSGNEFTVVQDGMYWLTVNNGCGTVSDTILVESRKVPELSLGDDRELCAGDTLHLGNSLHRPEYQYNWSNGQTTEKIVVEQSGRYAVTATNMCGTVTDEVLVSDKASGCECYLYVPNAFTPNGDGKNDVFKVTATCRISGELTIFNRWGRPVFSTKDLGKSWNGKLNENNLATDTYIYTVTYKFLNRPAVHTQKGTLVLIR